MHANISKKLFIVRFQFIARFAPVNMSTKTFDTKHVLLYMVPGADKNYTEVRYGATKFGTGLRAVPEIILGGHKHVFVRWGEGVLLTMCPRGGGWRGNLSWGSRHI